MPRGENDWLVRMISSTDTDGVNLWSYGRASALVSDAVVGPENRKLIWDTLAEANLALAEDKRVEVVVSKLCVEGVWSHSATWQAT